jgi:hypothetical protein
MVLLFLLPVSARAGEMTLQSKDFQDGVLWNVRQRDRDCRRTRQAGDYDLAEQLMGKDFWPYGYAPNVEAIDRLLRYHHEQGLSRRRLTPQEIFAPETFESFKI